MRANSLYNYMDICKHYGSLTNLRLRLVCHQTMRDEGCAAPIQVEAWCPRPLSWFQFHHPDTNTTAPPSAFTWSSLCRVPFQIDSMCCYQKYQQSMLCFLGPCTNTPLAMGSLLSRLVASVAKFRMTTLPLLKDLHTPIFGVIAIVRTKQCEQQLS